MKPRPPADTQKSARALTDEEVVRIRKRIERLLEENGGNQSALARNIQKRVAGFEQQTISSTLAGKPVGLKVARELAEYLGISLTDILSPPLYVVEKLVEQNRGAWSPPTIAAIKAMPEIATLSADTVEEMMNSLESAIKAMRSSRVVKH